MNRYLALVILFGLSASPSQGKISDDYHSNRATQPAVIAYELNKFIEKKARFPQPDGDKTEKALWASVQKLWKNHSFRDFLLAKRSALPKMGD